MSEAIQPRNSTPLPCRFAGRLKGSRAAVQPILLLGAVACVLLNCPACRAPSLSSQRDAAIQTLTPNTTPRLAADETKDAIPAGLRQPGSFLAENEPAASNEIETVPATPKLEVKPRDLSEALEMFVTKSAPCGTSNAKNPQSKNPIVPVAGSRAFSLSDAGNLAAAGRQTPVPATSETPDAAPSTTQFAVGDGGEHVDPAVQPAGYFGPNGQEPFTLPGSAYTGRPGDGYTVPGPMENDYNMIVPQPAPPGAFIVKHRYPGDVPWAPPGLALPWPRDEYLRDGGDRGQKVGIARNFDVGGLDLEDTIIHYDTIDGETKVCPSNPVCIYAPRFAAVRKIYDIVAVDQQDLVGDIDRPAPPVLAELAQPPNTLLQPIQPRGQVGQLLASIFRDRLLALEVHQPLQPEEFVNSFKPFEDFQVIRVGLIDNVEQARLAIHTDAAIVWTAVQGPQVVVDNETLVEAVSDRKPQVEYTYDRKGAPCVKIIKVASRDSAKPGEIVEFTLRFDNIGDEMVGNVTIMDNLTTRLEYVPNSAQCSLKADFFASENDGESLALRWQIVDPLKPGQGGIIRFQCRVR